MSTSKVFNGKNRFEPGAYSQIKSGIKNPPATLSSGNVLIIDTGRGAGYGGGAGINGTLDSAQDAIYSFTNLDDFRNFIGGGAWHLYANALYRPDGAGINGASIVRYVRAATTTPASVSETWAGGGANGGTFTLRCRAEGHAGDGIEDETVAVGTIQITGASTGADTVKMTVDAGDFATYTAAAEAVTVTAQGLADAINTAAALIGTITYIATVSGDTVTITAPKGQGVAANSLVLTAPVTGTITTSVVSFAGGADGSNLKQGYAYTMEAGTKDTAKYVLKFWRGTFVGNYTDGIPYNEVLIGSSPVDLVAISDEFDNVADLFAWMAASYDFTSQFELQTSATIGDGSVDAADLAATAGNQVFAGGSELFATTDLDDVLDSVTELDYTYVIANDSGSTAYSADNVKVEAHILLEARYQKFMGVAGGDTRTEFAANSIAMAALYDTSRVILAHGGTKIYSRVNGSGERNVDAFYFMCQVIGRRAGLAPQIPLILKPIEAVGLQHNMKDAERELAMDSGVTCAKFDGEIGKIVINHGINTLQDNKNLVNPDGQSHDMSVMAIAAQMNKEIEVNAKLQLLVSESGPNRNTVSANDVEDFVKTYLKSRTATTTADNLIISFSEVAVKVNGDIYSVTYNFEPNFPVKMLFFTGFMIDPNIS
jgi:hypothetical protein